MADMLESALDPQSEYKNWHEFIKVLFDPLFSIYIPHKCIIILQIGDTWFKYSIQDCQFSKNA